MLEKTENEETRLFCHIFVIGGISIGGWPMIVILMPPPLATPMIVILMLFVILRFCVVFCLFVFVCMSKLH